MNAVWVKNEWSRFLALIKKGENKALIPAYKDMDPYDLPEEFSHLQAQDMSKLGFMQDLIRGIKKIVSSSEHKSAATKEQTNVSTANDKTAPLLKRVFMFLEDGDWKSADEYCEKVLDIDPENAEAYVGKLMAEMHFPHREELGILENNNNANFKKALQFGGKNLVNELTEYRVKKVEQYIREGKYAEAIKLGKISKFIIPDGLTSIKNNCFDGCTSLKSVTIPNSVNSIGDYAFNNCVSLTSVIIPNGVTSIAEGVFFGCSSLMSVVIPDGVTSIGKRAFCGCSSLTSIIIPDGVTSIGKEAFCGCGLTNATIPKSMTSIGESVFAYCDTITSLSIPKSVKSIGEKAFYDCTSLTSITIPSTVTMIKCSAFSGCDNLKSVYYLGTIDQWVQIVFCNTHSNPLYVANKLYINNELVTEAKITTATKIVDYALPNCSPLLSLTIGDRVTSIGQYAFSGCDSLENITISDSIISIGEYAFKSCKALKSVNFTGTIDKWVQINFRNSYSNPLFYAKKLYINNELITKVKLETSTKITSYALYNCLSLQDITIGNNVTWIGQYAFCNCLSLKNVIIGNSVASIGGYAFYNCNNLSIVKIRNKNATIGKNAFDGCPVKVNANKKSGGCYVATCVYGSYDCPEVWTLRRYRDDTLGATWYGRAFIKLYYAISPTLFKCFGKTKWFKKMWKGKLDRMVEKLQNDGVENTPYNDKEW